MTGRGNVARTAAASVLLVSSLAAVLAWLAAGSDDLSLLDLRVYQDAVLAWTQGRPVYDLTYTAVELPFTYPPFGLVALAWAAPISFGAAAAVMTAASMLGLGLIAGVLGRRLGWRAPAVLVAAAVALLTEPVRATLSFGQVNLVLLVLVVVDAAVVPVRFRGILTGAATAVKLTPGIFLLYFLLTGQRRVAVRQLVAAAGCSLLAVAVAPGSSLAYWTRLVFQNRAGAAIYMRNQALSGLIGRVLGPSGAVSVVTAAASLVVLVLAVLTVRACARTGDLVGAFAATAVAGLLISPISWDHHWVWALPLVAVLIADRARRDLRAVGGLLLAVLVVGPQTFLPSTNDVEYTWVWWQLIVGDLFPLVAVLALAWLLAARMTAPVGAGAPIGRGGTRSAGAASAGPAGRVDGGRVRDRGNRSGPGDRQRARDDGAPDRRGHRPAGSQGRRQDADERVAGAGGVNGGDGRGSYLLDSHRAALRSDQHHSTGRAPGQHDRPDRGQQ